jgi:hypothetical protein
LNPSKAKEFTAIAASIILMTVGGWMMMAADGWMMMDVDGWMMMKL